MCVGLTFLFASHILPFGNVCSRVAIKDDAARGERTEDESSFSCSRCYLLQNRMDLPLRITQRMRPYFNPWLSASSEEEQEDDNNHVDVENSIVREEGGMEEVEIEVLEEVEVENVDGDRIELHEPVGAGDVSG